MGIDPLRASHHVIARKEGLLPASLAEAAINTDLDALRIRKFRLKRTAINWVAFAAFRSKLLTTLVYDCRLADWMHVVLYKARRWSIIARLAYGDLGMPPIEGRRR